MPCIQKKKKNGKAITLIITLVNRLQYFRLKYGSPPNSRMDCQKSSQIIKLIGAIFRADFDYIILGKIMFNKVGYQFFSHPQIVSLSSKYGHQWMLMNI